MNTLNRDGVQILFNIELTEQELVELIKVIGDGETFAPDLNYEMIDHLAVRFKDATTGNVKGSPNTYAIGLTDEERNEIYLLLVDDEVDEKLLKALKQKLKNRLKRLRARKPKSESIQGSVA